MSEPPVTNTTAPRSIEAELRAILEPLDRRLAWVSVAMPLAAFTVVPAVFLVCWFRLDFPAVRAIGMAGGTVCAMAATYIVWELAVSWVARVRFDERFPAETAERAEAFRVLAEMETPSRAEEKLRTALAYSSADRIVRRRLPDDPSSVNAVPPPLPDASSSADAQARKTAGAYDYIPLEPRRNGPVPPTERRT